MPRMTQVPKKVTRVHAPGGAVTGSITKLSYAARIRRVRHSLGLTEQDFGELMRVSAQTIVRWEAESHRPRLYNIEQLAKLEKRYEHVIRAKDAILQVVGGLQGVIKNTESHRKVKRTKKIQARSNIVT